LKPKELKWL